jgi:predicted NAD/FAD-binding protein
MSRLQRLDAKRHYLVSLNAGDTVPDDAVIARMAYEHPIYTPEVVAADSVTLSVQQRTLALRRAAEAGSPTGSTSGSATTGRSRRSPVATTRSSAWR